MSGLQPGGGNRAPGHRALAPGPTSRDGRSGGRHRSRVGDGAVLLAGEAVSMVTPGRRSRTRRRSEMDAWGSRVLLLIPAVTYRATDFLLAAGRLGLDVVVGSDGALPLGDRPVVHVDANDVGRTVDRLVSRTGPLDAVVAVATKMMALDAAVDSRLALPHNPVEAVVAANDKAEQRRVWLAAGVPQPSFRVVLAEAGERAITTAAAEVGFPCVVKAVSLSGSQGVLRADDEASSAAAARRIRGILAEALRPDHEPLLVEAYVPGWEVSIDGLLTDGAVTVTAVFDKPDSPAGPTFEETILISPSRLPKRLLAAAAAVSEQAARGIGLRFGPIHAELRMAPRDGRETPTMLELAARSIGGLCSRSLRFLDGVSLEEMVLANALGRPTAPVRAAGVVVGVFMLPVERAGVLRMVEGRREAA